jgi:hypothetical protein
LVGFFNRSTSLVLIGVSFFNKSSSVTGVSFLSLLAVGLFVDCFEFDFGGTVVVAIEINSKQEEFTE